MCELAAIVWAIDFIKSGEEQLWETGHARAIVENSLTLSVS